MPPLEGGKSRSCRADPNDIPASMLASMSVFDDAPWLYLMSCDVATFERRDSRSSELLSPVEDKCADLLSLLLLFDDPQLDLFNDSGRPLSEPGRVKGSLP